jgi:hypothetical protein
LLRADNSEATSETETASFVTANFEPLWIVHCREIDDDDAFFGTDIGCEFETKHKTSIHDDDDDDDDDNDDVLSSPEKQKTFFFLKIEARIGAFWNDHTPYHPKNYPENLDCVYQFVRY